MLHEADEYSYEWYLCERLYSAVVPQSASALLARGFNLSIDAVAITGICALCGCTVQQGRSAKSLIKLSTSDVADTFHAGAVVCLDCASCFVESKLLTSNLFASSNLTCKPFVALKSATPERPAWRNLVRQLPLGTECVSVVTSNTKRRLWPKAPLSAFGDGWMPLFVDGSIERVLTINVTRLRECLSLVEEIYEAGFSKRAIGAHLMSGAKLDIDLLKVMDYERRVDEWRGTDEFVLAVFIAQKESE